MDHRLALQPVIVALAIALALPVIGVEPAVAQTQKAAPHTQRMKDCRAVAERRRLAGDVRKDFISDCLSGAASGAPANSQQDKMRACNAKAEDQELSGDVRQRYMSGCVNG